MIPNKRRCLVCMIIRDENDFALQSPGACYRCFKFKKSKLYTFYDGDYRICHSCEKLNRVNDFPTKSKNNCNKCERHWENELEVFRINAGIALEMRREVQRERAKKYRDSNPRTVKANEIKRRTLLKRLRSEVDKNVIDKIHEDFSGKCMLTGSRNVQLDHFIALSTGHGGSYLGNLVLLDSTLNSSKWSKNPFEWIKLRPEKERKKFKKLVKHLADSNRLTEKDFEEFVYWCYRNKRTKEQITDDNKDSLSLWKIERSQTKAAE